MNRRPHAKRRPADRRQRGFTLTEVLIATLLVGAAIAGANAFFMAARAKAALVEDPTAHLLAEEVFVIAQLLDREPSGSEAAKTSEQILALDSLIGASFSPPIMANGKDYPDLEGWSQAVDLSIVDVTAPGLPLFDDPAVALDPGDGKLYQIVVTVHEGDVHQGTFTRLMAP